MVLDNMKKKISEQIRDEERAFYGSKNAIFKKIKIEGPADGESAFKECKNLDILNSSFKLRYPFWHNTKCYYKNCKLTKTARASFWYDKGIVLEKIKCVGVKAVRECKEVKIKNSYFDSIEFGWQCKNIAVEDSEIISSYAFLHSNNVSLDNVEFKGKYSFQYNNNLKIKNSILDTKDAFWHTKNAVIENCTIKGEYLAWYSENITFINCHIIGTQPLCYAKNIKLINCYFTNCDLAFEYTEVNGTINGSLISIKNPLKGYVEIDEIPEMIIDENDRGKGNFVIERKK